MMVVMFPETRYRREHATLSERQTSAGNISNSKEKVNEGQIKTVTTTNVDSETGTDDISPVRSRPTSIEIRTPIYENVGKGRPRRSQFSLIPKLEYDGSNILFRDVIAPFQIFLFPIVFWAAMSLGFAANCLLALNLTQSQVFAAPPYLFTPGQVGFVNFAFVVGGILGLLTAGPISDWVALRAARRNNGVREAEMRLVALVPYIAICLIGMTVRVSSPKQKAKEILTFVDHRRWVPASLALASCRCDRIWLRWHRGSLYPGNCDRSK